MKPGIGVALQAGIFVAFLWPAVLANPVFRQVGGSNGVKVVTVNGTQDCEINGRIFHNGDRIIDHSQPCEDCFCVAGMVMCSVIQCSNNHDQGCVPVPKKGQCCPHYQCAEKDSQEATEVEVSETRDPVATDVSKDAPASDIEELDQVITQVSLLKDESNTGEIVVQTGAQDTLSESDNDDETTEEVHILEKTKSIVEDEEFLGYTTYMPVALQDAAKPDVTQGPVNDEVAAYTIETYLDEDVTTGSSVHYAEREQVDEKTETLEPILATAIYSDDPEGDHTTAASEQIETSKDETDAEIREDKPEVATEEEVEETTESSFKKTELEIENGDDTAAKDQIVSTQKPDENEYQERYLPFVLEERIGQVENEDLLSTDLETSKTVPPTDSGYQDETRNYVTTIATNEVQRDELQTNSEFMWDSEVSTAKILQDETQAATESAIFDNVAEQQTDKTVSSIREADSVHTTEVPSNDDIEHTESSLSDPEAEIVNKIFRSEIEELKNELIIRVKGGENVSPDNENDSQTTKVESRTDEYETTEINLSDRFDVTEENLEMSLPTATPSPNLDSIKREDFTATENEDQTKDPSKRHKNGASDYWISMMENANNLAKNITQTVEENDDFEDQNDLKREESTTETSPPSEDATTLYLKSDLLFSEDNAEQFITMENISDKRDEELTTALSEDGMTIASRLSQAVNDEPVGETPVTESPTQKPAITVQRESEITTETSFGNEFRFDDANLGKEITTEGFLTTIVENAERDTVTEADILMDDNKTNADNSSLRDDVSLNEESSTETITKIEDVIAETTEVPSELQKETENTPQINDISENNINDTKPSAEEKLDQPSDKTQNETPEKQGTNVETVSRAQDSAVPQIVKPERIQQQLSHLAKKFGKFGLRPVLRRRGKESHKRRRVYRKGLRNQFLKRF